MRRWFELGELGDTTYAADSGDRQFLQLPQKHEFIAWANSMVGVNARLTTGTGDPGVCWGIGDGSAAHIIVPDPGVTLLTAYGEMRGQVLFQGVPPVFQGLCRQYFEKPGRNDGPNESGVQKKGPAPGRAKAGTQEISFLTYLLLLFQTWSTHGLPPPAVEAPQRWIEALAQVIINYRAGRVSSSQVYAWLNSIDFSKKATII